VSKQLRIGAAIMARNANFFIPAVIAGLSWVDSIFLYDDNSTDDTVAVATHTSTVPLIIERGQDEEAAFARGELAVRNYIINRAFEECHADVLLLVDSDELFSASLRAIIEDAFAQSEADGLCVSTWHLYTRSEYIHCWETAMNGISMLDPHLRVITPGRFYEPSYADGSHPCIPTTPFTHCVHGAHHFHLKYYHLSPLPNYALNFLPKYPGPVDMRPYLRTLPFPLPADVERHLNLVLWGSQEQIETEYYRAYECVRVAQTPEQVLVHPRDRRKPPC
jgi:hypothetical protein